MTRGSLRLVAPYRGALLGLLALVVASAAAEAGGLVLLSALLNAIAPGTTNVGGGALRGLNAFAQESPVRFLVILSGVYIGKSLIALGANYASFSVGLRMADDWRERLLHGYLTAPLQRLTRQQGSMLQIVLEEPSLVGAGLAATGFLAQNALSAASVYVALLLLSPVLTFGLTIMALVATGVVMLLSRYAQRLSTRRSLAINEGYAYITEMLSALKQLRLFSLEKEALRIADGHLVKVRHITRDSSVIASSPRLVIEITFLVGLALMLGVLAPRTSGVIAVSEIGLVVAAAFRLMPSLSASAGMWVQIQQAMPGMGRIGAELAELEPAPAAGAMSGSHPPVFVDRIRVEDVWFSYPGREQALRGIDLDIERGRFVGIVGASGAGKSTLIDLLCAFYPPSEGRILVDGVDLRQIDPGQWRRKLGVVAQDTFLFSGTIRENLLLLQPDADMASLERVVALVGADTLIAELPEGYETRVGERGLTLSGGQRQRLALARVLLRRPEVLIMDEATSALDVRSDELLQQQLGSLRGTMTTVVVAHRLSAVRRADRIYVMSEGRIAEDGTHDDLIARDGLYAAMWRAAVAEAALPQIPD